MILVCGEALVDLYVGGPSASGLDCEAIAGGSPFNVAIGVARLGTPAAFLGGVSTDRFGEFLTETLEREGVEKFADSFKDLFSDLESKRDALVAA